MNSLVDSGRYYENGAPKHGPSHVPNSLVRALADAATDGDRASIEALANDEEASPALLALANEALKHVPVLWCCVCKVPLTPQTCARGTFFTYCKTHAPIPCADCGQFDMLDGQGVCPSCAAERDADMAEHYEMDEDRSWQESQLLPEDK